MNSSVFQNMIEQAILQVHTGFFGKVVGVNGNTASVQPLNQIKAVGGKAIPQAIIENCPVLQSAVKFETINPASIRKIQVGDIVYCVCADRDISETQTGAMATPVVGHHMINDAVIVGIL